MKKTIYLDNGATTFPKPETVYKKIDCINRNLSVNPGRGHYKLSKDAQNIIERTREKIAAQVNSRWEKVIFTPSATIAMNIVLCGLFWDQDKVVYISPYEHNAVCRTLYMLKQKYGFEIMEMPVVPETLEIDINRLKYDFMNKNPDYVCLTHISNVTGYILPVKEIFAAVKEYDGVTILDAAQSMGLIPIDIKKYEIDFLVFAGHKNLYGPIGTGGLVYSNNKIKLDISLAGGTGSSSLNLNMPSKNPERFEPGSLNVSAIGGLESGIDFINNTENVFKKEKELTDYTRSKLESIENVVCYFPPEERHIGIISFNVEGYKSYETGDILDAEFNIAVRSGYHCSPYVHRLLEDEEFAGTVRIGVGYYNTKVDIDRLIVGVKSLLL